MLTRVKLSTLRMVMMTASGVTMMMVKLLLATDSLMTVKMIKVRQIIQILEEKMMKVSHLKLLGQEEFGMVVNPVMLPILPKL